MHIDLQEDTKLPNHQDWNHDVGTRLHQKGSGTDLTIGSSTVISPRARSHCGLMDSTTIAVWFSIRRPAAIWAARRVAAFRYSCSISIEIEFRPARMAATAVDPDPANGSRIMSPAKLNILIKRSANSGGKGAGCPARRLAPRMSDQTGLIQASISSRWSIESAFWIIGVVR